MEHIPHATAVIKTLEGGGAEEVEMLLSSAFRLNKAGIIRPGIMVLKSGCSPKEKETYEAMGKAGRDWDEIGKIIGQDAGGKSKLIPKNVDYFTIHSRDCSNPENAETIYRLYADPDGKLRSFPVWFPVNGWWNVIPHSLRCFGTSGLKYRGVIRNGKMYCEFPLPPKDDKKHFGGRNRGERDCNPEVCSEFQGGACTFGGLIQFMIPGIKGIGIWMIPTTSWYSLASIKSTLQMVSSIHNGRIAGLVNDKPFFRVRKKLETIYRTGSDGKRRPTEQWIIILDTEFDLMEIAKASSGTAILSAKEEAIASLEGRTDRSTHDNIYPPALTYDEPQEARLQPASVVEVGAPPSHGDAPAQGDVLKEAQEGFKKLMVEHKLEPRHLNIFALGESGSSLKDMDAAGLSAFTKNVSARVEKDKVKWIAECESLGKRFFGKKAEGDAKRNPSAGESYSVI